VYKIIASPLAVETYQQNIDFLEKQWSENEVLQFISNVSDVISILKVSPQTFKKWEKDSNIHQIEIQKQITLYYQIHHNNIELLLFFNNSSKSRINFETESVFTSFSASDINNKNSLFNMSFFYKPSKKLFFTASLNNIFTEQFFSTIDSNTNYVSEYKFSLRPRQFTVGLSFSF